MESIGTFFAMGGYAAYVWPALIVSAVVLLGLLLVSLRQQRAEETILRQLEERLPKRQRNSGDGGRGEPS
jgi:heme exporter protein D